MLCKTTYFTFMHTFMNPFCMSSKWSLQSHKLALPAKLNTAYLRSSQTSEACKTNTFLLKKLSAYNTVIWFSVFDHHVRCPAVWCCPQHGRYLLWYLWYDLTFSWSLSTVLLQQKETAFSVITSPAYRAAHLDIL